jgi:hypothetical protein
MMMKTTTAKTIVTGPFDGHLAKDGATVVLYTFGESTVGFIRGRDSGRKEDRLRRRGFDVFRCWAGTLNADDSARLSLPPGEWIAAAPANRLGLAAPLIEAIACGPDSEKLLRISFGID